MVVRMDQVLNNPPQKDQPANLQVALYAQWKDQNNQSIQKPIYLQSIFPDLDQRFGQSPYVMTVEGVKPTPQMTLSVKRITQPHMMWIGIVTLLLALLMKVVDTLNHQSREEQVLAS